jgi:hypothetical protein
MPKCTITFEDDEETGETVIKGVFEPAFEKANQISGAQRFGYAILLELTKGADSGEVDGD